MSRIANKVVTLPLGVGVKVSGDSIEVVGAKNKLTMNFNPKIKIAREGDIVKVSSEDKSLEALTGTTRVLLTNMVIGVTQGFEKKLKLVGVGYKAQPQGKVLSLTLGFSHPITYDPPNGISFEIPTPTDITVKGADKQLVGQVAADIRRFRSPEPYKGKGVRYADEVVRIKEVKKK